MTSETLKISNKILSHSHAVSNSSLSKGKSREEATTKNVGIPFLPLRSSSAQLRLRELLRQLESLHPRRRHRLGHSQRRERFRTHFRSHYDVKKWSISLLEFLPWPSRSSCRLRELAHADKGLGQLDDLLVLHVR